jgi:hypothetical protein
MAQKFFAQNKKSTSSKRKSKPQSAFWVDSKQSSRNSSFSFFQYLTFNFVYKFITKLLKWATMLLVILILIFSLYLLLKFPSQDRDWEEGKETLTRVEVLDDAGNIIRLINVRNATYDVNGYVNNSHNSYYNMTFDIRNVTHLWFFIEPFGDWDKVAHTFVTFDFSDGQVVSLSIEARMEKGEEYSASKGLLREFETIYIWANEDDHVLRRTVWRNTTLYMYPLAVPQTSMQEFLRSLLVKTHSLESKPEFYHTILSSCTSSFSQHVNYARPGTIKFYTIEQYLPGTTDSLLSRLGYINTDSDIVQARELVNINAYDSEYRAYIEPISKEYFVVG